MSLLGSFTQQPAERLDYDINYSAWLVGTDAIASVAYNVEPAGQLDIAPFNSSPRIKLWASGGQNNVTYKITVTATTDDGRIKQVEFKIKVKDA